MITSGIIVNTLEKMGDYRAPFWKSLTSQYNGMTFRLLNIPQLEEEIQGLLGL